MVRDHGGSAVAGAALGRAAPAVEPSALRALARMIDETREEILVAWGELLAARGLPYQRVAAQENPSTLEASFGSILDVILPWLRAADAMEEEATREKMRAVYRDFGWRWAIRERAAPDLVVDVPRITQAIWQVLLRRYVPLASATTLLNCVLALNVLSMELAMARVSGYLNHKEDVLASQQATLSHLMDELTRVELRQRRALALELHDNLAQRLASLFNGIQHCAHVIERDVEAASDELQHLRMVASEALRDARTMIRDLHFGGSPQDGRLATLEDYLADLDADTGIHHEARISAPLPVLPATQESLTLRVIQEALRNAHKHARPQRIVVSVQITAGDLVVAVQDDGCGFDVAEAQARSHRQGRLGLIGMRERAGLLGGSLAIDTAPGAGTTILMTAPLSGLGVMPS